MTHAHVHIIVNASAGGGTAERRLTRFVDFLEAEGRGFTLHRTTSASEAARLLQGGLLKSESLVAAAGGDGTFHGLASACLGSGSEPTLIPLPLGSGNDIARSLGFTRIRDVEEALRSPVTRRIDVMRVAPLVGSDPLLFAFSFVAAGFPSEVIRHTSPRMKRVLGGDMAYIGGFLKALVGYSQASHTIESSSASHAGPGFMAWAGNCEAISGGAIRLCPGAQVDDGLLWLGHGGDRSRLGALWCLVRSLFGKHVTLKGTHYASATEVVLSSDPMLPLVLDGESIGTTPVRVTCLPKKLTVLAPAGAASAN